jgi:hypothetical protein
VNKRNRVNGPTPFTVRPSPVSDRPKMPPIGQPTQAIPFNPCAWALSDRVLPLCLLLPQPTSSVVPRLFPLCRRGFLLDGAPFAAQRAPSLNHRSTAKPSSTFALHIDSSPLTGPRAQRRLPGALRHNHWAPRPLVGAIPVGSPPIRLHRRGGVFPGEPPSSLTPQASSACLPHAPSPSLAASPTGLTTGKPEPAGPPLSSAIGQWLPSFFCLWAASLGQVDPSSWAN